MLQFGTKPPFSYDDFLEACRTRIPASDMEAIEKGLEDKSGAIKKWNRFDRSLRNELARNRAVKKQKDPARYIKGEGYPDPFIAPFIHWAMNQDSPLDAEFYLDKVRWEKLDELAIGHYFDMDYLAVYGLKLKILERWNRINSGTGMDVLEYLLGTENR